MRKKIILITGASSGIGKACAEHLGTLGHIVYGTSRKASRETTPYTMIQMDVTGDNSAKLGITRLLEKRQRDRSISEGGIVDSQIDLSPFLALIFRRPSATQCVQIPRQ